MKEMPWPIYKIKLGTDKDVAYCKGTRKHTDAIFRLDANWCLDSRWTILNAPYLKELGGNLFEQPIKADDWKRYGSSDATKVYYP